jgi:hypothetical protein
MASSNLLFHTVDLGSVKSSSSLVYRTIELGSVRSYSNLIYHESGALPVALFEVLRQQTSRASPKGIGELDGADLTTIGKTAAGSAFLYTDANTTSVTIGGGASLSALCDLRDTNPTTLRSHAGQNLQLLANGAADLILQTNSVTRITADSAGAITATSPAGQDLTLGARGGSYALNDDSNTTLTTTNQTLVGAINELDAALAVVEGGTEDLLATIPSIDATTTGTTNLFTSSGTTIITKVMLLCTAATAITVVANAGVGIAAGEDDIFPSEELTGLSVANKVFSFIEAGTRVVALDTEVVKLGIDTAATGTSQTLTAYIFGFTV